MRTLVVLLFSALLVSVAACRSDALVYPTDQAAIDRATEQARASLPIFWAAFDATNSTEDFTMKVGLPTRSGNVEHIWMEVTGRQGEDVTGTLANDPFELAGLRLGSKVTVKPSQITDWAYSKNGKFFGHFTTRVLLPQMRPSDQAGVRSILAPTPLEQPAQ